MQSFGEASVNTGLRCCYSYENDGHAIGWKLGKIMPQ